MVRLDADGKTVSEAPATPDEAETEQRCDNIPALPKPTCANPHGIQAREDLDTLVTSDYNEPRNIILNPVQAPSSYLRRPTVRTWDISDRDHPRLKAVSFLPDGPRKGLVPHQEEPRAAMETTVTNQPGHKGAFAETMQGGAIYYTPDITAAKPQWREVFDLTTSNKQADPKLQRLRRRLERRLAADQPGRQVPLPRGGRAPEERRRPRLPAVHPGARHPEAARLR